MSGGNPRDTEVKIQELDQNEGQSRSPETKPKDIDFAPRNFGRVKKHNKRGKKQEPEYQILDSGSVREQGVPGSVRPPGEKLAMAALAGLLVLRFPLLIFSGATGGFADIAYMVYLIGAYLFTAIYISVKREDLEDLHVTRGFLLLWILLPLLALLLRGLAGGYYVSSWVMPLIAAAMFLLPAESRPRFLRIRPAESAVWLGISLLAGIAGGIIMGALTRLQVPSGAQAQPFSIGLLLSWLLFQLTTAALCEEPLFRGFLMDWFRKKGYGEWGACLLQAALFMLAQSHYLADGRYLSFAAAFAAGVMLGVLSWKSRSLTYPLLAHALMNAVADAVRYSV